MGALDEFNTSQGLDANLNATPMSGIGGGGPTPATTNNFTDGTSPGSILDGQLTADLQHSGTLYNGKTLFDNSQTGFILGVDSSVIVPTVKFYIGTASNYFNFDGVNVTISGILTASAINIPDSVSANSFHVDSSGNTWWGATTFAAAAASISNAGEATVSSLRRNDYHWFTVFESLSGYSTSIAGGSITIGSVGATNTTDNVSGHNNELQKLNYTPNLNAFTWDKNRACKFSVGFQTPITNLTAKIGQGSLQNATDRHIGFYIVNGAITATVANGTSETTLSTGVTMSSNFFYLLEYRLTAGSGVEFFVDNVSYGTITTNLPTGKSLTEWILDAHLRTDNNAVKEMWISFVDLWQSR